MLKEREPEENQAEKILNGLLTREVSDDEKHRIENLESANSRKYMEPVQHSDVWEVTGEKTNTVLREELNGKLLIDLGGADGLMKKILQEKSVAIKDYINVDKFYFTGRDYGLMEYTGVKGAEDLYPKYAGPILDKKTEKGEFSFSYQGDTINVSAGMLDFLQYIADNSVDAISINGIDENIVNTEYHNELANQIKRVLKSGGVVVGVDSDSISILDKDNIFELKWGLDGYDGKKIAAILEKK